MSEVHAGHALCLIHVDPPNAVVRAELHGPRSRGHRHETPRVKASGQDWKVHPHHAERVVDIRVEECDRLLILRAVTRLDYQSLLEFTRIPSATGRVSATIGWRRPSWRASGCARSDRIGTRALDKKLREALQLEIVRVSRELGAAVVYVTHDQEEALVMSDRIAIFRQGKIEQLGTGEDLYDRPISMFVADFIGESSILRGRLERGEDGAYLARNGTRLRVGTATLDRAGLDDGAAGALVVRPERMRIGGPNERPPAESNAVEGSVTAVLYLGSDRKYELALSGGERAVVRQQLGGGEAEWHRGDMVTLWWPVDSGVLVADRAS